MFSKVRVKKSALDYFRKHARESYPLEIQCYLLGNIKSINEIEITDIMWPNEYENQTTNEVAWKRSEIDALKEKAQLLNKRIVGTIHTHPNTDAVMSEQDYKSAITEAELLCGIVSVWGNKIKHTRCRFWTPTSALPCEKIYI
jgi:proteasome lid subunit RPN8/RPN11